MRDIAVIMPTWKVPELLEISIPSILKSITTNSELIVVLNEVDEKSLEIVKKWGVKHFILEKNLGPSAVDIALPYIVEEKFRYVGNVNSDMLFPIGWDSVVIDILESRKPCSVSPTLVEPDGKYPPPVRIKDHIDFFNENSIDEFNRRVSSGKYSTVEAIASNHPIFTTIDDFLAVNGYSDNMDENWIELKGRLLDPYFAYRLWKLYDEKFNFIRTNKVFVYHNTSYNRKKFKLVNIKDNSQQYFIEKTGMTMSEFVVKSKINA